MLGITHRGVKMPNIQLQSSIFTSFMIFSKILGGSIDPPDPPLTGPLIISLSWLKDKYDCFKTSILQFYQMFEVNNWMQNMKKNVWIKYMDWKCIEIRSHPDINLTEIRSWLGIKKSPNPSESAHNQTTQWDYPMRLLNETTNEIPQ